MQSVIYNTEQKISDVISISEHTLYTTQCNKLLNLCQNNASDLLLQVTCSDILTEGCKISRACNR